MSSYVYFWRTSDASRVSKFNAKFQERRIRRTFHVESALFAASVSLTAILAKSSILLTLLGEVKKWRLPQDSNILDWLSDDWLTTDSLTRLDEWRLTRLKLVILVGESMNHQSSNRLLQNRCNARAKCDMNWYPIIRLINFCSLFLGNNRILFY